MAVSEAGVVGVVRLESGMQDVVTAAEIGTELRRRPVPAQSQLRTEYVGLVAVDSGYPAKQSALLGLVQDAPRANEQA